MRGLLVVLLLGSVACSEDRPLPRPAVTIPSALQSPYEGQGKTVFVYDTNLTFPRHPYRLVALEGHLEGDAYVATRLARASLGDDGWDTTPIGGTLRLDPETLHVELSGVEAGEWNGDYESREARVRREAEARRAEREARGEPPPPAGACQRYRDCVCALSAQRAEIFGEACSDAGRLLASAADDPGTCEAGLVMHRSLAPELGLALPPSCE
ncbi:MAG: hypothetical protein H6723_06500 [Sandaracinus sp.]|nr:hypothetical protein [Sandaracinus sp.]